MPKEPRDRRDDDGTIVMLLTPTQEAEVQNGLDIDAADGNADWGYVVRAGRAYRLFIRPGQENLDAALYRITSSRDIPADNAGDSFNTPAERLGYLSLARSLESLTQRLITIAGGPEAFSPGVRKWI
jgi:hypothetical protein